MSINKYANKLISALSQIAKGAQRTLGAVHIIGTDGAVGVSGANHGHDDGEHAQSGSEALKY